MKQPMLPPGTFEGKNILITGGGSGLGFSMARGLLQLGAKVLLLSRNEGKLQKAKAELEAETGGIVHYAVADVRDAVRVEEAIQQLIAEAGGLDAVINNAAGNFISPTARLSANAFSSVIDIVLKGTVHTSLVAGKYWIANKRPGTFLNIVTTYASTGSAFVVPSAAAKAGVLAMTRSLAVEWAPYGIRSNAIAPGPFPTEGAWSRLFPAEAMPPGLAEKMDPAKRIPIGRVGKHEELANLACFLLSDYSAYINGDVITIDGGEWLEGAGEFNGLKAIPEPLWDAIAQATRKPSAS
jgi:NAD(P)-dependent dehydrogenase (short-subunit alcohol dehydrogenase family)